MILPFFDSSLMKNARMTSCKKNDTYKAELAAGELVPSENVYHIEILGILKRWFQGIGWVVSSEFSIKNKSADLVLTDREGERYVLELVAHARDGPPNRPGSVQEHFVRVRNNYSNIEGVFAIFFLF